MAETQRAHRPGWPLFFVKPMKIEIEKEKTEEKEKTGIEQERSGLLN